MFRKCKGGSLGKDKQEMEEVVRFITPLIPNDKPIHLLGKNTDVDFLILRNWRLRVYR